MRCSFVKSQPSFFVLRFRSLAPFYCDGRNLNALQSVASTFNCRFRSLGQIRRKLHLAKIYPLTDQSTWISCSLAALARLSVGGSPASSSLFKITHFSKLPLEKQFFSVALPTGEEQMDDSVTNYTCDGIFSDEPGLDVHQLFKADWVRQLLFDAADYVVERTEAFGVDTESSENVSWRFYMEFSF